jgi:nucleotidyltransferase substrate binding protein (TIGR01987 family)
MTDERLAQRVTTFTQAVQRLHDAVNQPDTEFIRDAVIRRFEFCYELAWKMLKLQLTYDGIEAQTPRHTIQMALQAGYIDDGNVWSEIQRMRNLTSHTYDAAMAAEVYPFVCTTVMPLFTQLCQTAQSWH